MTWNWQLPDWPHFHWKQEKLAHFEQIFTENAGVIIGASQHIDAKDQRTISVELMSINALRTSEIEGEYLNQDSLRSSILRVLGLKTDRAYVTPAEFGIAEMMVDLYQHASQPLTEKMLLTWHLMMMNGRRDLDKVGAYRTHEDEMQIVSGADYARKVHYEAPPSKRTPSEMKSLIKWIRTNNFGPVTRAGIAHIWFECIHPFEDGNGRIGRAISEKILTQASSQPTITLLSKILLKRRKEYYQELASASKKLDMTNWLLWFSECIIEAQKHTIYCVEFVIEKGKLLNRLQNKINSRQEKILLRMFREGPDGFEGGMSASKYMKITGAPPATATRDLHDLVEKGALISTGELKSTRYFLKSQNRST